MTPVSPIATVVLAAGNATRFGTPKLLAEWRGRPLLEQALAAAPAGGVRLVVLGPKTRKLRELCVAHGFAVVVNPRPSRGLASSLALALDHLPPPVEAALVLLGDEPLISRLVVRRMLEAWRRECRAVAASYDERRGHPVILPRSDWADVPRSGERAGAVLEPVLVECGDLGDVDTDVDTIDDLLDLAARAAAAPLVRTLRTLDSLDARLALGDPFALRSVDGKGVRTRALGDEHDEVLVDLATLAEHATAHGRGVEVLARAGDDYVARIG